MKISWFKFQLVSSNGVGCSEGAYIHRYIVPVRKLRHLYFTTFSYVLLSEVE